MHPIGHTAVRHVCQYQRFDASPAKPVALDSACARNGAGAIAELASFDKTLAAAMVLIVHDFRQKEFHNGQLQTHSLSSRLHPSMPDSRTACCIVRATLTRKLYLLHVERRV